MFRALWFFSLYTVKKETLRGEGPAGAFTVIYRALTVLTSSARRKIAKRDHVHTPLIGSKSELT